MDTLRHRTATGKPATDRAEQLRRAKRAQRARQRERGIVTLQWELAAGQAARLQAARRTPGFEAAFAKLLEDTAVDLHAWPALRELAWNRKDRWIPAHEALALYERNWRFVERDRLAPAEAELIARLKERFGGGALDA